jgi:hypothetical protein
MRSVNDNDSRIEETIAVQVPRLKVEGMVLYRDWWGDMQ